MFKVYRIEFLVLNMQSMWVGLDLNTLPEVYNLTRAHSISSFPGHDDWVR